MNKRFSIESQFTYYSNIYLSDGGHDTNVGQWFPFWGAASTDDENITITCLFIIYWKYYHQKNEHFQIKKSDSFHFSAQNIDCGYSL